MFAAILFLSITTQVPEQNSEDVTLNVTTEGQVQKEVIYEKEKQVEISETQVKGELKLPQGFSTLAVDAATPQSFLEERLKFKLREASRLGN